MMKKLNGSAIMVVTIGAIASLVVLGAISFVKAIDGNPKPTTYVIENVENIEEANITFSGNLSQEDISEGLSFGASGTRFPNGISADTTSPIAGEVRGTTLTLTGAATLSGENTLSGTTTIPRLDATFVADLDFQRPTTTYGGATEYELCVGEVQNTGEDLLCTDIWPDVSTAVNVFAYDLRVGSSTTATSSPADLVDVTDLTNEVATATTALFNKEDFEGAVTPDVWIWKAGYYLTVTQIWDVTGNATSSASLTAEGGNTGAGKLHVNCRNRY